MNKTMLFMYVVFALVAVSAVHAVTAPSIVVSLDNQAPDPVRSGDTADVVIRIENDGGPADNFQVMIEDAYPFTVVGENTQTLGSVSALQTTARFQVRVDRSAVEGNQPLKVRYRYGSNDWSEVLFPVRVAGNQFAQITIDKSTLSPGTETPLTFTITNTGSSAIQNMVFSWEEPNNVVLPVFSDNTKYVPYLDSGKSLDLTYQVVADVNAKPGLYYLDLKFVYQSVKNASLTTVNTRTGVLVGGETDFAVSFSESSAGQTSLSVANIGNNPALSVAVMIPDQPGYTVTGSSSAILGNLDKGDYTIASFPIVSTSNGSGAATGSTASGSGRVRGAAGAGSSVGQTPLRNFTGNFTGARGGQPLQVLVEYTDTVGQRHSVEKSVPIQFRGGALGVGAAGGAAGAATSSSFLSNPLYVLLGILIIVGGVWYFYRKQRKHA